MLFCVNWTSCAVHKLLLVQVASVTFFRVYIANIWLTFARWWNGETITHRINDFIEVTGFGLYFYKYLATELTFVIKIKLFLSNNTIPGNCGCYHPLLKLLLLALLCVLFNLLHLFCILIENNSYRYIKLLDRSMLCLFTVHVSPCVCFACKFWTCLWTCVCACACVGSGLRLCRESEQLAGLHLTTYWPALHSPVIQPNLMFPLGSAAAEQKLTSLSVQGKQVFSNLSKQFFFELL